LNDDNDEGDDAKNNHVVSNLIVSQAKVKIQQSSPKQEKQNTNFKTDLKDGEIQQRLRNIGNKYTRSNKTNNEQLGQ